MDAKLKYRGAPPLLPVSSMDVDETLETPAAPPPPRFLGLHGVSWWAIYSACAFAVFAAYVATLLTPCADRRSQTPWWWRWCGCRELAGASAARARAVLPWLIWCVVIQAAAAAAALLIPGRRGARWALALVAYGATAGSHVRFASLLGVVMGAATWDVAGVLWVVGGGVYLFGVPMFAWLSFGVLVTEYLEENNMVRMYYQY